MTTKTFRYTLNGQQDVAVGTSLADVAACIIDRLRAHVVRARFSANGSVEYLLSHNSQQSKLCFQS